MLYITTTPLSLLVYHIKEQYKRLPKILIDITDDEILHNLSLGGEFQIKEGVPFMEPYLYVIDSKAKKPLKDLSQSLYNVGYIRLDTITPEWKKLAKDKSWVEIVNINPNMYKKDINKFSSVFSNTIDDDAYNYFWEELCLKVFKTNPSKWAIEIMYLLVLYKHSNEKITTKKLKELYKKEESKAILSYIKTMGTKEGSKIIKGLDSSELWILFMSPNSPLHKNLIKKENYKATLLLMMLQNAIRDSLIDLRVGCILFNECLVIEEYPLMLQWS